MLVEIVLPTFNHPDYISKIMNAYVQYLQVESAFIVSVFDSSTNDATQQVMSEFVCDRVKYIRMNSDIGVDRKTIMALQTVTADYSFLCGDGYIVDIPKLISIINNANNKNEIIALYDSKSYPLHKFMSQQSKFEFTDKNEFFKLHFWQLTLYGGSICSRTVLDRFNLEELDKNFSGLGFIYPSALAINSSGPYAVVEEDILNLTDQNRIGGWEKNGNAIKTWTENFYRSVIQLEDVLDQDSCNEIIRYANKNSDRLTFKCLMIYRLNGNFSLKILRQYKFYFKKCKACSMFSAYLIACTPKWFLKLSKKIYKSLRKSKEVN